MRFTRSLAMAVCLMLTACPKEGDDTDTAGTMTTAGTADDSSAALTRCNTEPLVVGYGVTGPILEVSIVSMDPAPPRVYTNEWVVDIKDASGEPVTDASTVMIQPWMVAHNHGTRMQPKLVATDVPGRFNVENMSLHMKGKWDVRFMLAEDMMNSDNWTLMFACVTDGE